MNVYLRILRYVRPYVLHLAGSLLCIVLFTLTSSATLVSTIPLLKVIFVSGPVSAPAADSPGTPSDQPDLPIFSGLTELRAHAEQWLMEGGQQEALARLCIVIVCLIFFKGLFGYFQSYFMAYVEQGAMMRIRNDLYAHINRLGLSFFSRMRTGQIISHITNDVNLVNNGISAAFVTLVKNPLLILSYLLLAFWISWQLTLTALLILPFSAMIIGWISLRLRKESTLSQERMADVTSIVQETVSGIRVVKAFGMEKFEFRKFAAASRAYFNTLLNITRVRNAASPVTEFLAAIVGVGILWFGGQQILAGNLLGPEEFVFFLVVIFSLMQPAKELSSVTARLNEALAAGERLFGLLDTPVDIREKPDCAVLAAFESDVVFDAVTFGYGEDGAVLSDISLKAEKGEIIALVGPSGAGKTTLVNLIPRFYDPTEGSIRIDGRDLRDLSLESLRAQLGIVTQETILFHDTIRNNIAYGLEGTPDAAVEEAARIANAHRFVSEFPRGYDTIVGERGVKLSGGQRQRIAIARAVLKNPPILILDEATSALDSESEMLVQQAIERLMANRTTFVIAHRLSTILHAHKIVVLERGRIMQQGTHAELLEQSGVYQKLYQMQFRA